MLFTARAGEGDLLLPFGKARPADVIAAVDAMVAADACLIGGMPAVGIGQWHAAGMAHVIGPGLQRLIDRHPAVKDKALALPAAVRLRHILEIFQDAALQVIDLVEPHILHQRAGLLAADASGAEHGQLFRPVRIGRQLRGPFGKFAKAVGLRVDGAIKGADRGFIGVAGVDHHHIRIIDKTVPVARLDIGAGGSRRADLGPAHGDDLALQPHLHSQEGLVRRG